MKIEIGDIFESKNYGLFKVIREVDKKNNKQYFEIQFLNSGNYKIVNKYNILDGVIQDTDFIYKRIIGEIRNSNYYGPFKINKLLSQSRRVYYEIEFLNTGYKTKARKDQIDYGRVTDYSLKKEENKNRELSIWYQVLDRSKKFNICICKEWRENKEKFIKWFEDNKYTSFLQIDKDILSIQKGLKERLYSPETCLLLPAEINNSESCLHSISRIYYKNNSYYIKFDCLEIGIENCKLIANSKEELIEKYLNIVYEGFKSIVNKYKDILPLKIYNILMNLDLNKNKEYILKSLLNQDTF